MQSENKARIVVQGAWYLYYYEHGRRVRRRVGGSLAEAKPRIFNTDQGTQFASSDFTLQAMGTRQTETLIFIPIGAEHQLKNTGRAPLKLTWTFSPPRMEEKIRRQYK